MTTATQLIDLDWLVLDFARLGGSLWDDRWKKTLRICNPRDWITAYRNTKEVGRVHIGPDRSAVLTCTSPELIKEIGGTSHNLPDRDLTHLHLQVTMAALRGEELSIAIFWNTTKSVYFFGGFRYESGS